MTQMELLEVKDYLESMGFEYVRYGVIPTLEVFVKGSIELQIKKDLVYKNVNDKGMIKCETTKDYYLYYVENNDKSREHFKPLLNELGLSTLFSVDRVKRFVSLRESKEDLKC